MPCLAAGDFFSSHSIFSPFTTFPYVTSAPVAAALVEVPRVGRFSYVLGQCRPLTWTLPRDWQFPPPPQIPPVFITRSYETLFSRCRNPGLCGLVWIWSHLLPRFPSRFLSTTHECRTTHSASCCCLTSTTLCPSSPSLPLLPIWMNMASLNPWLSDFTVQYTSSSGCFLF